MKVKQAVKHFTLMGIIAVGISGCSSTETIEEAPVPAVVPETPVVEPEAEQPKEIVSAVINNGVIKIPVMEDAQIFAEFSDELPAVINYFTNATEDEVVDFYKESFGEAISQERKRKRLTLKYQEANQTMRVVVSQQNKKRQVDVIIESNK